MKNIYIPSKGRNNSIETINLFNTISSNIGQEYNLIIVVEPQEEHLYKKFITPNTKLQILKENDKGVAYVFHIIYDKIFFGDNDTSFLLDDDITNLYEKLPEGNQKTMSLDRIKEVFDCMCLAPYGINSLSFRQTQWLSDKDYDDFGRICTFICFNHLYMQQKEEKILNEINKYDTNKFKLYLENYVPACFLINNIKTGITYKYAQFTVPMAKNKGGAYNDYHNTTQPIESAEEIVRLIGRNFAKIINNKGRTEVKIDWKSLYYYYDGLQPLF